MILVQHKVVWKLSYVTDDVYIWIYVEHAKWTEKEKCEYKNKSKSQRPQKLKNKSDECSNTKLTITFYIILLFFCSVNLTWMWQSTPKDSQ